MTAFQSLIPVAAALLVMFVPATRTELRNTRESPLQPLGAPALLEQTGAARVYVVGDPAPRTAVFPLPAKRRVPAGAAHPALARGGPLAWVWADLDYRVYPVRRAADGRILAGAR